MRIIALEHECEGAQAGRFSELAEAEAAKVWELQQREFIREIYFRADERSAVLVLESPNVDQARQKLSELPFVAQGLIDFELVPLRPYTGFARLFRDEHRSTQQ